MATPCDSCGGTTRKHLPGCGAAGGGKKGLRMRYCPVAWDATPEEAKASGHRQHWCKVALAEGKFRHPGEPHRCGRPGCGATAAS